MNVTELKEYCKSFGLKASGKKADIQQRLKDYVKEQKKKPKMNQSVLKKKQAADKKKWDKICDDLKGNTVKELKAMLEKNFVKRSGNKQDLIERIAECKLWGTFPECPECGGGKLKVTYPQRFGHDGQGDWKCGGFMDDDHFRNCSYRTSEPQKRRKWKDK